MGSKTTRADAGFSRRGEAPPVAQFKPRHYLWTATPLITLLLLGVAARGQQAFLGTNFNAVEYYKPPHDAQMKSLVQGARGERRPDGHSLLVDELKLQTFREDNERELLVEAPQCIYDEHERSASS